MLIRIALVSSMLLSALAGAQPAQEPDDPKDPNVARDVSHYNLGKNRKGPAIKGYDPVAYFKEGGGKAIKGKKAHSFTYRGVTYRFSSAENLARFRDKPQRYEPAYGGWCAFAMADGRKVEIDPKAFVVRNDRVYLFYKSFVNDTRKPWKKDPVKYVKPADRKWDDLTGEKPPSSASSDG